jgi:hypothetical protein
MTTVDRKIRYRIAISTSVKGIKTFDCTVDGEFEMAEILKRSDELVKELDARYPAGGTA